MSTAKAIDTAHSELVKAIERKEASYLWTPADSITFTPRVLPKVFGDGRALLALKSINQRPAYWVIRIDSSWENEDIHEHLDDIWEALEDAFGNGRCGYSGNNLFWTKRERIKNCHCEECSDSGFRARWPMVDAYGGCSWGWMKWPNSVDADPHPLHPRANLLGVGAAPNPVKPNTN